METPEIYGDQARGFNFGVDNQDTPKLICLLRREVSSFRVHIGCGGFDTRPDWDMFEVDPDIPKAALEQILGNCCRAVSD